MIVNGENNVVANTFDENGMMTQYNSVQLNDDSGDDESLIIVNRQLRWRLSKLLLK